MTHKAQMWRTGWVTNPFPSMINTQINAPLLVGLCNNWRQKMDLGVTIVKIRLTSKDWFKNISKIKYLYRLRAFLYHCWTPLGVRQCREDRVELFFVFLLTIYYNFVFIVLSYLAAKDPLLPGCHHLYGRCVSPLRKKEHSDEFIGKNCSLHSFLWYERGQKLLLS